MKRYLLIVLIILSNIAAHCTERPQIWDFGAVAFDRTRFENMLSVPEINTWMPAAIPGDINVYIYDFEASYGVNLRFEGHECRNHKLRTTNLMLSHFDEATLYDKEHDATFTGFLVSGAHSDPDVYIEQEYREGDYVEFAVASSGVPATYQLKSVDEQFQATRTISGDGAEVIWFTIPRRGLYRLSCLDDNLTIARIVRYAAEFGELKIDGKMPKHCSLNIVNRENGAKYAVGEGRDRLRLPLGFIYDMELTGDPTLMLVGVDSVNFQKNNQSFYVKTQKIELNTFTGRIIGLPKLQLKNLQLELIPTYPTTFHAFYKLEGNRYTIYTEPNNQYIIRARGVNDYVLDSTEAIRDELRKLKFTPKPVYEVHLHSPLNIDSAIVTFHNINEYGYSYSFRGCDTMRLRNGTYSMEVTNLPGYRMQQTSNLVIYNDSVTKHLTFVRALTSNDSLSYTDTLHVGFNRPYSTITQALLAVDRMLRNPNQHVTIAIDPGQYNEMLHITQSNITLCNSAHAPATAIYDGGVHADTNAVRITGYYGEEYNYYSMSKSYKYSLLSLQINRDNKALGVLNKEGREPSFYNATVIVTGTDVTMEDLIIENAFNRYVTIPESNDIIVPQHASTPQRSIVPLDKSVQETKYHRQAAALAVAEMADRTTIRRCRIIGVEKTIYGDAGCRLYIDNSHIMGATDIFSGGMSLLCHRSSIELLQANPSAFIAAARTQVGLRGFLFYDCRICSAEPTKEMADYNYSEPRFIVKPQNHYGEVVFVNTRFDLATESMSLDKALNNRLIGPGMDQEITPYIYTRGTDCWNPTNHPDGEFDSPVDLNIGVNAEPGQLILHHVAIPTTMRIITPDGSAYLDQLLSGTLTVPAQAGTYWIIFENNQGRQSTKIQVPKKN